MVAEIFPLEGAEFFDGVFLKSSLNNGSISHVVGVCDGGLTKIQRCFREQDIFIFLQLVFNRHRPNTAGINQTHLYQGDSVAPRPYVRLSHADDLLEIGKLQILHF